MRDVVIIDGVRTPIGNFVGGLKDVSAKDLAKVVMKEVISRSKIDINEIDEIVAGNSAQPTNSPNIGRTAALELGFPETIPGYVVNRNCASGLQAIVNAYQSIRLDDTDVNLVVGTENMSQMPHVLRGLRDGLRMGDAPLIDSLTEMLRDPNIGLLMGQTAEIVAKEVGITREEQDAFALDSHRRAITAQREQFFEREIVPVQKIDRRGNVTEVSADEGPMETLDLETLSNMRPVFEKDGTVTSGNACGTNDAAASVLMMSAEKANKLGLAPRARIVSYAFVGIEPERMGLGPVYAVERVLEKTGLTKEDIDLFELNEAFAAQAVACMRMLQLDPEKVNPHGGAIALGHPVGATGVRLVLTLLNGLEKINGRYGVATLCIGGGMGGA
ncbi:MAG TPA: thiolase family protein, partial [Pseudogracilibacillus sp.]|nr:thiolase family protein [Pseudogracilibacillus sp.]